MVNNAIQQVPSFSLSARILSLSRHTIEQIISAKSLLLANFYAYKNRTSLPVYSRFPFFI
jgi:hypothetical protein